MDLMSAIAVWAFVTLLLLLIVGMCALAAMFIYPGKPEVLPPQPGPAEPLPMSEMEPEGIEDARSLTYLEYRRLYFGTWNNPEEEKETNEKENPRSDRPEHPPTNKPPGGSTDFSG
jgi:hypothetical protein